MLHLTFPSHATHPSGPASTLLPDAHLLALAPELEAAATPYLAFDRDAELSSRDPGWADAIDTARALYSAVDTVAERIFAHEPQTLAGLLLTAHAAALTCSDTWDEHPDNGGKDGRLLRLVCNGLFRLAGVDWRGRPLPGAEPPAETRSDPSLAAMVSEWQATKAWMASPDDLGSMDAVYDRNADLQRRVLAHPCASLADLCAKLPLYREELAEAAHDEADRGFAGGLEVAAWHGLVQDLETLGGVSERPATEFTARAAPPRPARGASAPTPSTDAALIPLVEAALAEERAAQARAAAPGDVRPGNFARSLHLLELVTEQDAHTPAGLAAKARVLLAHASGVEELDGDWRCEALSLSIARDAARLGGPALAGPYAMAAE